MDRNENDEFNIDFQNGGKTASEEDTELSFMNFSLRAENTAQPKEDKILADLEKMSIFDFTGEKDGAEETEPAADIEEVPVEAVSEDEITEEPAEETEPQPQPETIAEYAEEPLPEVDDVEIDVVNWGQRRKTAAPPARKQAPGTPLFIDDTKPAPPPRAAEDVEIKLCDFRQSAQRRVQKNKEKQKKN